MFQSSTNSIIKCYNFPQTLFLLFQSSTNTLIETLRTRLQDLIRVFFCRTLRTDKVLARTKCLKSIPIAAQSIQAFQKHASLLQSNPYLTSLLKYNFILFPISNAGFTSTKIRKIINPKHTTRTWTLYIYFFYLWNLSHFPIKLCWSWFHYMHITYILVYKIKFISIYIYN